jgi:hypothetical protein
MTAMMAAAAALESPATIASTMRSCHSSTVSRSCGATGALRNDARNALPHHSADPRLGGAEQSFGNQRFHTFPQDRPRHPKHRDEFSIAGQPRSGGVTAIDDADAARHFRMIGMGTSGGNDDEARCHGLVPALPTVKRRAMAIIACCRTMKANSGIPVKIFVHQLESVPSKVI